MTEDRPKTEREADMANKPKIKHLCSRVYIWHPLCVSLGISLFLAIACDDQSDPNREIAENESGENIIMGGNVPLAGEQAGEEPQGGMVAGEIAGSMGGIMGGIMGGTGSDTFCTPGESIDCLSETERSVCDASGFSYDTDPCPEGLFCLRGVCGDQRCEPGERRCSPQERSQILICDPSGREWLIDQACEQGLACQNGACMTRCEAAAKLNTYIGCEYWTVDLDNYPDPFTNPMPNEVPHSVVIANPGDEPAMVRFETRANVSITPQQGEVPPHDVRAFTMPRLDVDNTGITNHAIKLSSSMPVIAYQFNPLNNDNVYSNDASLLLPVNTLGQRYIVTSWPTGIDTVNIIPTNIVPQAGYFTVVAVAPGETEVTIKAAAATNAGPNIPEMMAGETRTFTLQQFDVLNLQAATLVPANFIELISSTPHDLTGSVVESTQRVAVFGGHEEAVITLSDTAQGSDSCCADHLEEQLLPLTVWSTETLCVKAKPRGDSSEKDVWRVISGEENNRITTIPPIEGLNGITLNFGEWVQIESSSSFKIVGTGVIQASQFLLSQGLTQEGKGDPSMILTVPTNKYRAQYDLLVPMGYGEDWVTVIRPSGVEVLMNGAPLGESFTSFGEGTWEFAYVPVTPGTYTFGSSVPFGLVAYGWNNAVSYGYPAGLDLGAVVQ